MAVALIGVSPSETFAKKPVDPVAACANLAAITKFPVMPAQITMAKFNAAGTTSANGVPLPDHCQVQGVINKRIGTDGFPYGIMFEVRLPTPTAWNGRFMFQGGGGSEGSVPPATGTAGTLTPTLAHGWAVATQDGGHENSTLPFSNEFFFDAQAVIDEGYHSIDVTTQTAKFLIKAYYNEKPDRSYYYGCSNGGRQGMVFMQTFPDYYDGIVVGDPVYDLEAITLSMLWGVEKINEITPAPIQHTSTGNPILYPAFPLPDQQLFQKALLQACDGLDGVVDGVIDDLKQCKAKFDPATYVFSDTNQPLQCAGGKTASCLAPAQVNAVKAIVQGPRTSSGEPVFAPAGAVVKDHANNRMLGYPFDGAFMAPSGIPSRKIGTATTAPGDYALGVTQLRYGWITPPNPTMDPLTFDFTTDLTLLIKSSPQVTVATSTNIKKFIDHGGKAIWFHGLSDPGVPVMGTVKYYNEMSDRNGGVERAQDFSRLYLVPNMAACSGGPSTDQFDMLTPLVNWVEKGHAPHSVVASGTNFVLAPTTRSRPLCPYPEEVRYTGGTGGDLSLASNYSCVKPFNADHHDRDHDQGRGHDHDGRYGQNDHDHGFGGDRYDD
jgi:hypothetical protein